MPRSPRRLDSAVLRSMRDRALAAGGMRRIFPLTIEQWVARAPREVLAGVIRALLDMFPEHRRPGLQARLRAVMEREFAAERVPAGSRRLTPALLIESVATPHLLGRASGPIRSCGRASAAGAGATPSRWSPTGRSSSPGWTRAARSSPRARARSAGSRRRGTGSSGRTPRRWWRRSTPCSRTARAGPDPRRAPHFPRPWPAPAAPRCGRFSGGITADGCHHEGPTHGRRAHPVKRVVTLVSPHRPRPRRVTPRSSSLARSAFG